METQEFDEELQETNRIYKEIGDLNTKELLELQGAITQIREKSQKEKKENTLSWLELSVISVLKDYAEEIGGTFNSEDDEAGNRIMDLILTVRMSVCGWRSQWQAILTLGMVMGRVF